MAYIVKQPVAGGKTHIHLAENRYVSEKRGARQSRTYLGVLNSDTDELILGANLPDLSKEVVRLLKAKGIAYTGKRSKGPGRKRRSLDKLPAPIPTAGEFTQATVKEIGRVMAFEQIAGACGLTDALSAGFGESLSTRILSVATFLACDGAPMYLADAWADDVGMDGMSSSSISRLCSELGDNGTGRDDFFQSWIEACGTPQSLIHDTTSISTYSELLNDAEWGYNRDGDRLPQINLALVVSRETRLPLWYRQIPGSIPDVSTLKLTCRALESLGLNDFTCSLDRGYFSRSNVSAMLKEGIGFTVGVPLSGKDAKQIVVDNRRQLDSVRYSFLCGNKRLRHLECTYRVKTDDGSVEDLPGHLFFDPERAVMAASRIEAPVLELEQRAQNESFESEGEAREWISDNCGKLASCFDAELAHGNWVITRHLENVSRLVDNCGLTLVLTSEKNQQPAEVLEDYRCRDIAEKFFDIAKNNTGGNRMRTGDEASLQGRLFIIFTALILRCNLEKKLKESGMLKKYTVDKALALLRKIRTVKLADGRTVTCEVPKKTRDVAKAIGLKY